MLEIFIVVIICSILLFALNLILTPVNFENWTIENVYKFFGSQFKNTPLHFTERYDEKLGLFKNYNINDTGDLEFKWETNPIDSNGTVVDLKKGHGGNYKYFENYFTIDGVSTKFQCPSDFTWNEEKKTCTVEPVCDASDTPGTIKGLTYYNEINNRKKRATKRYHDRRYAICKNEIEYDLGECKDNQIYNQLPSNPAGYDPCVYYDICNDEADGYVHFMRIDNDNKDLTSNQYYMCNKGESVLKECTDGLVYSTNYRQCVPLGECVNKPDDFTFIVDDKNYKICKSEKTQLVNCPFGLYENGSKVQCKTFECDQYKDKIITTSTRESNNLKFITGIKQCIDNTIKVTSVEPIIYKYTDPIQNNNKNTLSVSPITNLLEPVPFPSRIIYNNGIKIISTIKDIPTDCITNYYNLGTFNEFTPTIAVNVFNGEILNQNSNKYKRDLKSTDYIDNTGKIYPITRFVFGSYVASDVMFDFNSLTNVKSITPVADSTFVLYWVIELDYDYSSVSVGTPSDEKIVDNAIQFKEYVDNKNNAYFILPNKTHYDVSPLRIKGMKPYPIDYDKKNTICVSCFLFLQRQFSKNLIYFHSAFGEDEGIYFNINRKVINTTNYTTLYFNFQFNGEVEYFDYNIKTNTNKSIFIDAVETLHTYVIPKQIWYNSKVIDINKPSDMPESCINASNVYKEVSYNGSSPVCTINVITGFPKDENKYMKNASLFSYKNIQTGSYVSMDKNIFCGYSTSEYYNFLNVIDVVYDGAMVLYWVIIDSFPFYVFKNTIYQTWGLPLNYEYKDNNVSYEQSEKENDGKKKNVTFTSTIEYGKSGNLRTANINNYTPKSYQKYLDDSKQVLFVTNCLFAQRKFSKTPILFHSAFHPTSQGEPLPSNVKMFKQV